MRDWRFANRLLIGLFAVMSGLFKVAGGAADLRLFAALGMAPPAVLAFGAIQAAAGLMLLLDVRRTPAALLLAACNAFATLALFVNGVQPFGVLSIVFVVMAAIEAFPSRPAARSVSQPSEIAPG